MSSIERIVVTWLATAYGGAEKSTLDLCRTMRRNHSVAAVPILWHYGDGADFSGEAGDEDAVHCYNGGDYRQALSQALACDGQSTAVISNHRTYQIDLPLAQQRGIPSAVVFRQTPMPDEAMRALPSPTSSELVYARGDELDWKQLNEATALVGVSDFGTMGIARFAPQHPKIVRIYNGPTVPGGIGAVAPRRVRRFLIVARLIDWKAIDFAIEAFSRLCSRYPDVRLQIAGDGEEETNLRQLAQKLQISDRVDFLGFAHNIRDVYLNNDCLLHTSGIESFGRVVIEASLCGIPVVVPQSAGTGELVINEVTGITFDPKDLDDCVRALEMAYGLSADEYTRLATAAQSRAVTVFHPDRVADDYVSLANSMIHR